MNNRNLMFGLLTGLVVALVMVVPVSATTVIDFEEYDSTSYCYGAIENTYDGLIFSGAKLLIRGCSGYNSNNYPPYSGNVLFYNPDGNSITIEFTSPASRVSIWYTSFSSGNIDAYDSNNILIDSDSGSANIGANTKLEVSGSNIAYVILHDTNNQITFDYLEYDTQTAIPEFPNIAIPVLSVLGLVFMINRRMK